MTTAKKKPQTVFIRSRGPKFRRAGISFTQEAIEVDVAELTDAQRQALQGESQLVITDSSDTAT
ncbi:Uncharacterised protein [BD1-7 clade bacterium]|uniref:Mu-like prophage FluMu N-terminal domain-containing protein n=1 Tax=BD1-7 clade bacterium TaxID=2029982 RepID=A0A5S9Q416_9GAMM|nr:Uncharacterised protein [BD1-7 clade bacterium]CAA0111721.1 Uncharacterised protein [BD1-7 clade bacterium]